MKQKQFIFALVAMLLSFVSPAFAQVAKVGNTEYATIDEAIANWTNGTTLTLLADVTLSDVIKLSSTEHHILDLGTYTMTAKKGSGNLGFLSNKDAIEIVNNGRSSASYALDIKADATNPGGITASGKAVVKTTGKSGVQDRPIIRFYNGVFTGTNVIYHSGSNGTNCPQFWFYGGEFNGTIYANRAKFCFYGGTFNGSLSISVDSSADALVSGGKFKSLSNSYGSTLNTDKFTIGSAAGVYDRGIYVDAEGYYVITSAPITEVSAKYPAVKKESYNSNNYFYYSAAAANGMFYEVASMATGSNVTVYEHVEVVEELDNNAAVKDFTPELPSEVVTFEVEAIDIEATAEATTKVTFNVEPKNANGAKVSNPSAAITFRLPVPAAWSGNANVYHEGTLLGAYTIKEESGAKYVEVSSSSFSEFSVEAIVPTEVEVATLAELQAALADNSNELPIVITAQIEIPAGVTVELDLNGKTVNSVFNGNSTTNHIYALSNKGTLTIQDSKGNGSVNSRGIYNYGSLTLNAGAINAIDGNGGYAVNNQSGSTFVMNGGVVAATNEDDHQSSSGGYDATALKVPAGCTATLNGGTINNVCDFTYAIDAAGTLNIPETSTITVNGTHGAIAVSGGVTTIDAGTFQIPADNYSRTDNVLYVSGGSLVVNGGTFIGDSDTAGGGSCLYDAAGKAVVNGGTFKGSSGGDVWGKTGTTIKGGTFENLTETKHIADGYELNADGTVAAKPVAAKIGDVEYATLAAAVEAAQAGAEIVVVANVADVTVDVTKNLTISGDATLNNVGINANGADALTVKGLTFTGNSWINSGTAEALTVSGITATVAPSNTSYTNSRSAFISLGRSEGQELALTVENSNITVTAAGADAILGWAAITKATITGNVIKGSSNGYFTNADAIKFMAIADGAEFEIKNNEIWSNYNGIVFGQNTTRANAYSVYADANKFVGGADHIWIEVSGANTVHATVNATSANTVNGNAFTINDIKYRSVINTWSSYAGVDVETNENGKVIGGTLASYSNNECIAEGYEMGENGVVAEKAAVAIINGVKYATIAEALAAAKAMTGDVTVEIYEKVTLNGALTGNYASIKFVGQAEAAEIYLDIQGYSEAAGKKVAFENLRLSKVAGGYITNAGFMNLAFGIYGATETTYTNCTFVNGAYASTGTVTFTGCTFYRSHDRYGLWAYGDVDAIVDGCKFADIRGIKMYAEGQGAEGSAVLTVKNTDFTAADNKPAIVLTYGESVTLEGNTYSSKGVFELDLDGAPNGVAVTSDVAPVCVNDNGACGVLVDGKIYTTVAQAAEVATKTSTVTLLHSSNETVEFPMGTTIDKNGFTADNVTTAQPFAEYVVLPISMTVNNYKALFGTNTVTDGTNYYATLQAAVEAVAKNAGVTRQANAVLYCKPGADVGSLQHAPVVSTLTIYGNGANVTGGSERDFDLGNTDPSGGRDITADMTLTVKHLNGCGAWGAKATEHIVNLVFENCANMGKVFITGTTGTLNITMNDCAFEGVIKEAVYSNADGAITLNNVAFSNLNKAVNLNHKAAGTQIVTISGCSFTNCGADVAADQIPVRVLSSVDGGKTVLNVSNTTFTGTPANGADILLDYAVGLTEATVAGTTASVVVEKENNVGTKTEVSTDNNYEFTTAKPVANIGNVEYATLEEAAAVAQAGDVITLNTDATLSVELTLPAGVTLNGNGKQINGDIIAGGEITFAGVTKANSFNVKNVNTVINIPAGASLELTGGRMVIGHGCTFNITGSIADNAAKTTDKATLTPSLVMPGASFTGAGVTFNVTNAYISAPSSYCSSSKTASGTFDFNITNSIWESAGKLAFESQSTAATVNFDLVNSVLNTGSHLVFGVSRGEVVIDNSNVNVGKSNQIENQSTMTIKNGSVVNGAVATSSNAKNPGTIIVENATYAVTGEFSGSDLGTGTLIIKKGANVSVGSIKAGANVTVDAEGMAAGDEINFTANLSQFTGTLSVINNDKLEAKIVDGKVVLAAKPVAKIGEVEYTSLEAAFAAATEGQTITLLDDATPALTSQRAITKAAVIDLGGKTMTLKEDDLYFGTTTFKNGTIIVDSSVKPSTAVFWMFANQTLTFDNVKIVATGVTGTYLIGLEGENSDLNLLNGSEILVENTTALDLDIICVNGTNTCDIKVENSKVNVTNIDGRVFFRGNYTVKDSEVNLAGITKAGFRIEAGQTLSIEGTSVVKIEGEPRDGGIHLTDLTSTYTKTETATVNATLNRPAVAKIGDTPYYSFAEAAAAANAGDEIVMLADATVEGTLALPAGIKLTSNGHTINGSIRMLGNLELNGPLTITGGLWVGKSGETLTATLSGDKLTASYFMFQRGTYTIDADIDAVYGYLSYEGTFEVNSTIHTTGANGEVLYIRGNVNLNADAVLDSDNSVFLDNNNAVLTLKPGSKVDSNVNITASGAKLNIDATGMTAGASANITGTVTNSGNGTIAVVGNDKLEAKIVDGKVVLVAKVAKIGEQGYATLQAAIEAVQDGQTIVLIADITVEEANATNGNAVYYTGDKSFTIDLNDKTVTGNTSNVVFRFQKAEGGAENTITIQNGKVMAKENTWSAISVGSNADTKTNIILTGLEIEACKRNDFAVRARSGAIFTITDCTITANAYGGGVAAGGGEVTMTDVTINQYGLDTSAPWNSAAFGISSGGKMTINSGSYYATPKAAADGNNQGTSHGSFVGIIMNSGGTLIINGGTFTNDNFGDNALATAARGLIEADAGAVVEINGGIFNGLKSILAMTNNLGDANKNPSATIKGGTFSADPRVSGLYGSNLIKIAEGYVVTEKDGVYTVAKAAAKIGDTYYATLEAALAAQGNEVELLATYEVAAGETKTLDLKGKTVTMVYTAKATKNHTMVSNSGNLTIESSVEGGKLSYTYAGEDLGVSYSTNTVTSNPGSVLTVKSGTIENLTYDKSVIAYAIDGLTNGGAGDVTVNIEGGVITSKRQAVRIFANSTANTGALNISGGEFTGRVIVQNANANANKAALNITGGTFNANEYKSDVLYVGGSSSATIDINASVSRGTFNGEITETNVAGFITGGTYKTDVNQFCALGYQAEANAGLYTVKYTGEVAEFTIVDGEYTEFNIETPIEVGTLTYERNFSAANRWNALYVPFEIPVELLTQAGYEVAYVNDVHSYDNLKADGTPGEDGVIDDMKMEVILIKNGKLNANYPYLIRANSAGLLSLEIENAKLYTTEEKSVSCSSVFMKFEVTGIYESKTAGELGDANSIYALGGGVWTLPESSNQQLKPFRLYLKATKIDGSPVVVDESTLANIRIRVAGEKDEVTGIITPIIEGDVHVNDGTVYDLMGRPVRTPEKGKIYIMNGKKVLF